MKWFNIIGGGTASILGLWFTITVINKYISGNYPHTWEFYVFTSAIIVNWIMGMLGFASMHDEYKKEEKERNAS